MAKNKDGIKASKPSKEDIGSKSVKSGHVGKASNAQSLGTIKFGGKSKPTKAASDSEDSETSDSSASSESESEEESEEESKARPAPKTNGHANGKSKAVKNESDDSESSEEESGSDDDEMEASADKPAKANGAKVASKKTQESDDSEDESDDGNSDEESDEEEKPAKAAGEKKTSAKAAKASDDGESNDSEEDSDDSDNSSEEDKKAQPKKRKADEEAVQPAKKSRVDLDDSSIPANLFVGNLTWNVDEIMLREAFESFGTLKGARVMTDRNTGRSKGYGYIEFEDVADAKKAYESMKDTEIDGRIINLDYAKPNPNRDGVRGDRRAQQYGDELSQPSATIFVGNVSFEANEEMLSEAFSKYGTITGVRLPTDPETGSLKGYGYVEFASIEDATTALNAMKGYNLAGRPLRLDFSTPRAGGGGGRAGFNGRSGVRGRGFGDRGRGGRGGRGGFNDRGGRGGGRGRGGFSTNRGGFGDYKGNRHTFD